MRALLTDGKTVHLARHKVKDDGVEVLFIKQEDADRYAKQTGGTREDIPVNEADLWIEGLPFNDTEEAERALEMGQVAYDRTRKWGTDELVGFLGTDLVKERLAGMEREKQLQLLGRSVVALRLKNMGGGK